ncbi:dihydroorotase [Alphaproteobacteria bacterium]|nr:dihydroorotase [Alphaproteobacteria bacterium]
MKKLTIARPDDWHLHLRDGEMLASVVGDSAAHFARAIIMPNLVPPVVTSDDAAAYRERIIAALPAGSEFKPLMTLYLTEQSDPDDIVRAADAGLITAVKLYPAGATTNSTSGVSDFDKVMPVLEAMAAHGIPLCVHGEVTDPAVDIFDREAVFLERVLDPLRRNVAGLRVVLEHVTSRDGVDYVIGGGPDIAATITTHHLMINRNHILAGGIRPHYYCLPVAKREAHRLALVAAATSGNAKFFLGTDSAPHVDAAKQSGCGCAGIYTAPNTMSCLATVFEAEGELANLEAFTSLNGPAFYRLPVNDQKMTLVKRDAPVVFAEKRDTPEGPITVFDCAEPLFWDVE